MELISDPLVKQTFTTYPNEIMDKIHSIRQLIIATATEFPDVKKLEESLKWSEPSYRSNIGSTLRLSWSPKRPNQYGMYYQCTSLLGSTFTEVFKNVFTFDGTRGIIFKPGEEIPVAELRICIQCGLRYHKIKHLPLLGLI